jgi:hypothetical protein
MIHGSDFAIFNTQNNFIQKNFLSLKKKIEQKKMLNKILYNTIILLPTHQFDRAEFYGSRKIGGFYV